MLNGFMTGDAFRKTHIKLDMRNSPSSTKKEADYPYLVFRRVTSTEDNQLQYARERIELEIIGLRSSATLGDDFLERMREAILAEFSGKLKTWGKFDASGNADANGGLKLRCNYVSTVEGYSPELDEKAYILIFLFTYLRP